MKSKERWSATDQWFQSSMIRNVICNTTYISVRQRTILSNFWKSIDAIKKRNFMWSRQAVAPQGQIWEFLENKNNPKSIQIEIFWNSYGCFWLNKWKAKQKYGTEFVMWYKIERKVCISKFPTSIWISYSVLN